MIEKISDFSALSDVQRGLFALLAEHGIATETWKHPPIFTVEEGEQMGLSAAIPGQGGKSLLLTNKEGQLWLVVACDDTRVNLKVLAEKLQTKRFSFAKPDLMLEVLGVTPGAVTPFALINDQQRKLRVVLDSRFLDTGLCVFHPLENTYSTNLAPNDLVRFIKAQGYEPLIMDLT